MDQHEDASVGSTSSPDALQKTESLFLPAIQASLSLIQSTVRSQFWLTYPTFVFTVRTASMEILHVLISGVERLLILC